jgi:hypothetical protein
MTINILFLPDNLYSFISLHHPHFLGDKVALVDQAIVTKDVIKNKLPAIVLSLGPGNINEPPLPMTCYMGTPHLHRTIWCSGLRQKYDRTPPFLSSVSRLMLNFLLNSNTTSFVDHSEIFTVNQSIKLRNKITKGSKERWTSRLDRTVTEWTQRQKDQAMNQ